MSLENNAASEWFPAQNKNDEEMPSDEKLNELEAPTDLEIPSEQVEEQD